MIALSIRQPWPWLIFNAGKDIENRSWPTKVRGRILVHASKGMTRDEYYWAEESLWKIGGTVTNLPPLEELQRGGFVGSVEIVDCVSESDSPWFAGDFGFVLRNPKPMPFVPWKGSLGFFRVPDGELTPHLVAAAGGTPQLFQ